jgi:hypothetical protein
MLTVNIIETEYFIFDLDSETGLWTAYRQSDGAEIAFGFNLATVMADANAEITEEETS